MDNTQPSPINLAILAAVWLLVARSSTPQTFLYYAALTISCLASATIVITAIRHGLELYLDYRNFNS
jgi:hypothetical protein